MFQPQPTPFAASVFNSYGASPSDFSFPLTGASTLQFLPGAGASNTSASASGSGSSAAAPGGAPPRRHANNHHPHPHSHSQQHNHLHLQQLQNQLQNQHQRSHPHQHTHTHTLQLQLQHQQSLLYSASASASSSVSPVTPSHPHGHFSPATATAHNRNHNHSLSSTTYSSNATPPKMEQQHEHESGGDMMGDELAAQEAAAREYQPQLEGPLVSDRIPSSAISEEYAKADPIYVEKTLSLPGLYSHYRAIQGDGNCGWRAIGFSYFETLIQLGDRNKVETELARITSLDQALITVGYDPYLFEDMSSETTDLLRDIAANMASPQVAMATLTACFNERNKSNGIIYHLRLLAASWLKSNPAPYEPFIPEGMGIAGYCTGVIEKLNCEIEQLGIMLLVNILLKPVGFVLEIAYLDRSPGSQVNVYRFPEEANAPDADPDAPVIHLLFRPDHYDVLYRAPPVTLQINRATSFTHQHDIEAHRHLESFASVDYAPLAMLPSFSYAPGSMGGGPLQSEALGDFVSISQQQQQQQQQAQAQWMPQGFPEGIPHAVSRPAPPQQQQQTPHEPSPARETTSLPSRPAPSPAAPATTTTATATAVTACAAGGGGSGGVVQNNTYPLRFSPQCYKLDGSSFPEPNFTTAMFKNSHYNKAHYNNPHFHPEEWTPDDEFGGRRRRRNEG